MMTGRMARDELKDELQSLSKMELGSEEYKNTVDGITKLWDRVIEEEKLERNSDEQAMRLKIEQDLKLKQMKEEKVDRIVNHTINSVDIISKLGLVVWGTFVILSFEKEGTVTTGPGRAFVNSIFRFIK